MNKRTGFGKALKLKGVNEIYGLREHRGSVYASTDIGVFKINGNTVTPVIPK
jgi:hypothetical protein